ncbi:MAG: DUF5685 family protein [Eubacteriales bacterium]
MFGYVTVHKPEMKIKDFEKYRAYYCGLCKSLKEHYGFVGQMTLTYDMTFAIVLLTSLYETEMELSSHRCVVHPMRKHRMLQGEITEYAAAMNVVLAYYHCEDDWNDEKKLSGFASATLLKKKVKKIEEEYPRQCSVIREKLNELQEYEKQENTHIDMVAGCFGELMSEFFVYREDRWEESLRKIGFYLGKYIYIMDAFDDIEKDMKKKSYNPLKELYMEQQGHLEVFESKCWEMLQMMIAECSVEFEKLPCLEDIDILRNIIYDGVWTRFNEKVQARLREEKKNEQKSI